jgi:hypothetical protein
MDRAEAGTLMLPKAREATHVRQPARVVNP